jgi:hypothetical protein
MAVCALALGACGGGERQDADEPERAFAIEAVDASFPAEQSIAQRSTMRIRVRNADTETVPNVAVTVETEAPQGAAPAAFGQDVQDERLADANRPVWIVDRSPVGGDSAYTNTWQLGALRAGETKTFEWRVTAVKAGDYTINWRVSPGLTGKATPEQGRRTSGRFRVSIEDAPPDARIAEDGRTVLREGKPVDREKRDLEVTGGSKPGGASG